MQFLKLLFWLLLCQLPAWAGAVITAKNMEWYHGLAQPSFLPPDWAFPAVWGVLYVFMGAAGFFLVRDTPPSGRRTTLVLFIAQLACNALWTPVFFGRHAAGAALFMLSVLVVLVAWLLKRAWHGSRPAFWLLAPYWVWLGFAWTLNYSVMLLN